MAKKKVNPDAEGSGQEPGISQENTTEQYPGGGDQFLQRLSQYIDQAIAGQIQELGLESKISRQLQIVIEEMINPAIQGIKTEISERIGALENQQYQGQSPLPAPVDPTAYPARPKTPIEAFFQELKPLVSEIAKVYIEKSTGGDPLARFKEASRQAMEFQEAMAPFIQRSGYSDEHVQKVATDAFMRGIGVGSKGKQGSIPLASLPAELLGVNSGGQLPKVGDNGKPQKVDIQGIFNS